MNSPRIPVWKRLQVKSDHPPSVVIRHILLFVLMVIAIVGSTYWLSEQMVNHRNREPFIQAIPDISAYALALIGAALPFLSELLKMLEQRERKNIRFVLAAVLVGMAIFALISNHAERVWESQDKQAVTSQLTQLLLASSKQATSDDIKTLDAHFFDGTGQVVAAIKGVKPPPPPTTTTAPIGPTLPPALVQNLTVTSRRVPSTDPALPYGLEVIVQSNITLQPVGFALRCTGPVEIVNFYVVGEGVYMNMREGFLDAQKTIPFLKFSFPSVRPETPLVITLRSKTDVRVQEIEQVN